MNYQSSGKTGKRFLCFPSKLILLLFCVFAMSCNRESGVEPLLDETNSDAIQLGASVNLQTRATEVEENVIVRMTTTEINLSFEVIKTEDIEVDWGDGTKEYNVFQHTYTDRKNMHEVVFRGSERALTSLDVYYNGLTSLDVSQNAELIELSCGDNQLIKLDVSRNMALTKLWCSTNLMTSLDVSQNAALMDLECADNQLIKLDVSRNAALTTLGCSNNLLTDLDVSRNAALEDLDCGDNQLIKLDVSKNLVLRVFGCYNNQLSDFDISKNLMLKILNCDNNPFIFNVNELTAMANDLPNWTGKSRGVIYINNSDIRNSIRSICNAKNWAFQ